MYMTRNVAMIVRNSTMPMISPVLRPIANSSTTKTMRDRLAQVEHELVGGRADRLGLEVDLADLDADRLVLLELLELAPYALAHRHDVAALHGGDAQADGRLAVVAEQTARRVLIAALQRGDVPEEELAARLVRSDHQLEHVIGRAETALRIERDVLIADAHAAAVGGDVPRLQLGVDLLLVDAELRQPLPRDFEEDDFLLGGEELDLLDVRHQQQLAAQELGVAAQLRERVAVAGNGQEDAVDVAEIVDHHRPAAYRGRQLRLDVVDLATQLVPHLGDRVLVDTGP